MKHILMIAYTRYSRDSRIKREAEALAGRKNYRVTLFTTKEGKRARNYEQGGVRVNESWLPKYQGSSFVVYIFSYFIFMFLCFRFCITKVISGQLNVVHVHNMPNFLIFGALPVKLRRGKIVLDVHDTMLETFAAKFQEDRNKLLMKVLEFEESVCSGLADAVIAVNEPQAKVLISRGVPKDKISVVMNVPDDGVFDYNSQFTERKEDDSYRIAYHGTVAKRNGVDLAVRAVVNLRNRIPGIELSILGFGDYLKECRRLVEQLNAVDFVFFQKEVASEKIIDFLKGMDLEIVTNQRNPASELMLPVKLMECVALGIPVITARLHTVEQYFTEEMVYFYEPENLSSLIKAIVKANSNRETSLNKARKAKSFLIKHGWNAQKNILFNLYRNLQNEVVNNEY